MLYHELGEADFQAVANVGSESWPFDFGYVEQMGLALIEDNSLRLAFRLPASGK